jgi:hypothetical protein
MLCVAAAGATAAAHLQQPRRAGQGAAEADCVVAWLRLSKRLLLSATPLSLILEGDSEWCASEAAALCITLPGLALTVLRSDAAVEAADVDPCWAAALELSTMPVLEGVSDFVSRMEATCMQSKLTELTLLYVGLQAAALHQLQAGLNCIPADPVAAAGLNSSSDSHSSNGSSGGGGGGSSSDGTSSSQPAPPRLAVPAFHQSLLRQVPHLDLMLQQPRVTTMLLQKGCCLHLPKCQAAQACGSSFVPLSQVLVQLVAL